jgi:arsenate reductase
MAEALINQLGAGRYRAVSAGSQPTGAVHPRAIAALRRHRIEAAQPRSKSWDEFAGRSFDLVITVCDQAQASCPVFTGAAKRLHWSTPDPAGATGSAAAIDAAFDAAFYQLRKRIESELL